MVDTVRVLSVSLDNRPGALGQVCRLLAKENINIEALEGGALGEFGFARFQTNNPERAEALLRRSGYTVVVQDVLEVLIPNRPGEIASVCERLAEARVNIECIWTTSAESADQMRLLVRVNNLASARLVFKNMGLKSTIAAQ